MIFWRPTIQPIGLEAPRPQHRRRPQVPHQLRSLPAQQLLLALAPSLTAGKSDTLQRGAHTMLITTHGRLPGWTRVGRPLSASWVPTDKRLACNRQQLPSLDLCLPDGRCVLLRPPGSTLSTTTRRLQHGMILAFLQRSTPTCHSTSATLDAS